MHSIHVLWWSTQRYVLAKHTLSIEVDFMLKDTLEVRTLAAGVRGPGEVCGLHRKTVERALAGIAGIATQLGFP